MAKSEIEKKIIRRLEDPASLTYEEIVDLLRSLPEVTLPYSPKLKPGVYRIQDQLLNKLVRLGTKARRKGYFEFENGEAHYQMDDDRKSSEIYREGESLVITHSDTDPQKVDFLRWLRRILLIMLRPLA
jgi:hypothetical protein